MGKVAVLKVGVALDPVPGTFHEPEDFVKHVQRMVDEAFPWYNPVVQLDEVVE